MSADVRNKAGHGLKSNATRERAICALLTEKTIARAGKRAGIAERTLRRWMSDDEDFIRAYEQARRVAFTTAMDRIQSIAGEAVRALEDLLRAGSHPHIRLGAARTVIELALRERDTRDILQRLSELEERLDRQF